MRMNLIKLLIIQKVNLMTNNSDIVNRIIVNYEQGEAPLPTNFNIEEYIAKIIHHLKLKIDYIEITLLTSSAIQKLNHQYFKADVATDTISFNLTPEERITGDLYLCPATIHKNASEFNMSYLNEFQLVLIHSVLHLMGKDDESEAGYIEMKQTQERILDELSHA